MIKMFLMSSRFGNGFAPPPPDPWANLAKNTRSEGILWLTPDNSWEKVRPCVDTSDHFVDLYWWNGVDRDTPLVLPSSTPGPISGPRWFEVAGHGLLPIGAPIEDHWPGKHPGRPFRAVGRGCKPHERVGSHLPATGDSTALDPLDDGGRHENAVAGAVLELDGQHLG